MEASQGANAERRRQRSRLAGRLEDRDGRWVGDVQRAHGIRAEFDRLGFTTHWIPMDEVDRGGYLVARRAGKGKRVLILGHLDTVFEPSSPFQRFSGTRDTVSGPGVLDMKGGLVVLIAALEALESAGALEGTNLTVMLHGDEEKPGQPHAISRRDVIEAGKSSDVALSLREHDSRGGAGFRDDQPAA